MSVASRQVQEAVVGWQRVVKAGPESRGKPI